MTEIMQPPGWAVQIAQDEADEDTPWEEIAERAWEIVAEEKKEGTS
ncbi:MAG: hypothetical protein ACRDHO_05950 [Actinomycetota bacterium]